MGSKTGVQIGYAKMNPWHKRTHEPMRWMASETDTMLINIKVIADCLGVHVRHARRLAKQPGFPKLRRSRGCARRNRSLFLFRAGLASRGQNPLWPPGAGSKRERSGRLLLGPAMVLIAGVCVRSRNRSWSLPYDNHSRGGTT